MGVDPMRVLDADPLQLHTLGAVLAAASRRREDRIKGWAEWAVRSAANLTGTQIAKLLARALR
jgi:hypothetical protein